MKKYKRLKDPIYGYIQIPMTYMSGIVDSATFQRLRRIIQTSYSPLYSSAVHNRFVHSLGVYHLGTIAANSLCREITELRDYLGTFGKSESFENDLDTYRDTFLLACLLHDVGHAPFSHTGEKLYLGGTRNSDYSQIHKDLVDAVGLENFERDIPDDSNKAAPHEIMSAIVGIRAFSEHIPTSEIRDFFARCITGYKYSENTVEASLKNCFVSLLNSKVIDVDKLDYLIRDAYITGFDTVSLDYLRLLEAITIKGTDTNWEIGYYKDAFSVIENVVYAHDAERKWIQNHPVVLYECYILNHIFQHLNNRLNTQESKLFSYDSLTMEGHVLKNGIKVSLLCDDDIIYLMKNVESCKSELALEYFDRSKRRHPIWKSEAEYTALITHVIGGNTDSMDALEHAMNVVATYLTKTTDTWTVNDETVEKLEQELQELHEQPLDADTIETQRKDKDAALKLMKCLIGFAENNHLAHDFVIIEASQFSSGFAKPDFSKTPIIFNSSSEDGIETDFETVAKPLQPNEQGRKKFYYLFYRRQDDNEEIDKAELCKLLAGEFATSGTKKRIRHE